MLACQATRDKKALAQNVNPLAPGYRTAFSSHPVTVFVGQDHPGNYNWNSDNMNVFVFTVTLGFLKKQNKNKSHTCFYS